MPRGVATEFLRVLDLDVHAARRRTWVLVAVVVLLTPLAWLLAPPWGPVTHLAAAALGLVGGLFVGHRAAVGYEAGLRSTWKEWMRLSVAAESVPEIHRKARGRSLRNLVVLYAAVLTVVWALEVLLLALALMATTASVWGHAVVAANAVAAAGMLGHHLRIARWTRSLRASIKDMMRSGEIGAWGVM